MAEIQNYGSITAGLSVYRNWQGWVRKHGADAVYDTHEGSAHIGAHAIKLIGFGVSQNKKYWLLQNSWGPNFGDHGTIKMIRGSTDTTLIWDSSDVAQVLGFAKAAGGQNCGSGLIVDTAADCKAAGAQVGYPFDKIVSDSSRPAGCFWDRVGMSYFNEEYHASSIWSGTGGICWKASKSSGHSLDDAPVEITGGWHEGDATDRFWNGLARHALSSSAASEDFQGLIGVQSQVTAGFNARFQIVTTSNSVVSLEAAYDADFGFQSVDHISTGKLDVVV